MKYLRRERLKKIYIISSKQFFNERKSNYKRLKTWNRFSRFSKQIFKSKKHLFLLQTTEEKALPGVIYKAATLIKAKQNNK